jgi:hypothetical protein
MNVRKAIGNFIVLSALAFGSVAHADDDQNPDQYTIDVLKQTTDMLQKVWQHPGQSLEEIEARVKILQEGLTGINDRAWQDIDENTDPNAPCTEDNPCNSQ